MLAELCVYPLGQGESVGTYVAECVAIIDRSGLAYQCHAMGTLLEGELDDILRVAAECIRAVQARADRVECLLRIDHRRGHDDMLHSKVASVERQLGGPARN